MGGIAKTSVIALGVALAAALGACAPEMQGAPAAAPSVYKPKPHAPGPMEGVRATKMTALLAAAGLDVANLPPIEQLTAGQKQKVMRTFTETLGVPCLGCHAEDDFPADTRRKRIAKRMYNEMVRELTLRDGEPVYCDSCHDGTMHMLDRRDTVKLTKHMSETFVGQFARVDGRNHDCATCHGEPPDYHMLTTWKLTTAPDIAPVDESGPGILTPPQPWPGPGQPRDCGPNSEQCALQRIMRADISIATANEDKASLALALDRIAAVSPDPSWTWEKIAKEGADAARRGDLAEAKKSCGACHVPYKSEWRTRHRTRAVP